MPWIQSDTMSEIPLTVTIRICQDSITFTWPKHDWIKILDTNNLVMRVTIMIIHINYARQFFIFHHYTKADILHAHNDIFINKTIIKN